MPKLDWEKQNRSKLVAKRLRQYLEELGELSLDSSGHEAFLNELGFPPSIDGVNAIKSSFEEGRRESRRLRHLLERKNKDSRLETGDLHRYIVNELTDIYTRLMVVRLIAIYPKIATKKS